MCQRTELNPKYRTNDVHLNSNRSDKHKSTVLLYFFSLFVFGGLLDIIDSYITFHAVPHKYIGEFNLIARVMLENYGFYGLVGLYHFVVIAAIMFYCLLKNKEKIIEFFMWGVILAKFGVLILNFTVLISVLNFVS